MCSNINLRQGELMSHLQKGFIAKAKAFGAKSKQPHRMSRNLIMRHATHVSFKSKRAYKDEPWCWHIECPADYLQFSLKK
jgi:hypothetical protein